jgi:hypothetical protein
VSLLTVNAAAAVVPKDTPEAPVKPLPVSVITELPGVPPDVADRLVTAGTAAAVAVKWSAEPVLDVPLGVVTVRSTVPAAKLGAVARRAPSDSTVNAAAAVVPKVTALAPVKPLPKTATVVPPAVLPELGVTLVTAGAAAAVKV